jgi:hypothetical protein
MVSIQVSGPRGYGAGEIAEDQQIELARLGDGQAVLRIRGSSLDARTASRLLRHDFPSQVTCNHFANIASFPRRLEGCFA